MATDRFVYMYIDEYQREDHERKRNRKINFEHHDAVHRDLNVLKRGQIIGYGKILRALGYKGSMEEARRVFLDPELRSAIDEEWAKHEAARGTDELIMALELMEQRLRRRNT